MLTFFHGSPGTETAYGVLMRVHWPLCCMVFAVLVLTANVSWATGPQIALEGGLAWQGRNDFRIPGDQGSLVPLAAADSGPAAAVRATVTFDLTARQSLRLLAAPLRLQTPYRSPAEVRFTDRVFAADQRLDAIYRFDSYRLTWYWRLAPRGRWTFRVGGTLKVRDAEITLAGVEGRAAKTNLGLVPLLYGHVRYAATERLAFELEADALAAPQGRAEDVSLKGVFSLSDRLAVEGGYRLLEGGADNDEVFTFAAFHYAIIGIRLSL